MTPYKQTDPRWNNVRLGYGPTTIGKAGCVISCIGYLHNSLTGSNLTPLEVNTALLKAKAYVGDLVLWSRVPKAFPELQFKFRDYNYKNLLVWSWINIWPRLPVLVQNLLPGSSSGSHWRLFLGNQKCYNPLSGSIESTSVYKILTGSARFTRG
jgi:hypothetical protein